MATYRTRKELAGLTMAEVLAALDTLSLEPTGQVVFMTDALPDAQGCPRVGEPPAYLHESQKIECRETGKTQLTLEQQVNQRTTLELWRLQVYAAGVEAFVKGLGMARCLRELRARKLTMTVWEQRRCTRQEVEGALINAIHNEQERDE